MTLAPPDDARALLSPTPPPPSSAPAAGSAPAETAPAEPARGMAGLVAEIGRQHRAWARDRHERRQDARDRAARRASNKDAAVEHGGAGLGTWLRALPGRVQEGGVQLGYGMALSGSGVGQLSWWSSQFPLVIAGSFALTFEAIMLGASRRARRLRLQGQSAAGLRLIAVAAATFGTVLNWVHLSDPATTLAVGHQVVHGSPNLGLAFAAFTALGFATHEVSTSAEVRSELIRTGIIRPLGARRWAPPFTLRAWRTRLLLIERPELSVEQAWHAAVTPRRRTWVWRRRRTDETASEASMPQSPQPQAPAAAEPSQPEPEPHQDQDAPATERGDVEPVSEPSPTAPSTPVAAVAPHPRRSASPSSSDAVEQVRRVAANMIERGDWISQNEICTLIGVGKGKAGKIMRELEREFPHHPQRRGGNGHDDRLKQSRAEIPALVAA